MRKLLRFDLVRRVVIIVLLSSLIIPLLPVRADAGNGRLAASTSVDADLVAQFEAAVASYGYSSINVQTLGSETRYTAQVTEGVTEAVLDPALVDAFELAADTYGYSSIKVQTRRGETFYTAKVTVPDEPAAAPTEEPTATPTTEPTATPTEEPTATPTEEPTSTPEPSLGVYHADYFDNMTLSGTPVLIRDETAINHYWGAGSLDAAVPVDGFSARWTVDLEFEDGTATFTLHADDGSRLLLDGQTVIDAWDKNWPSTDTASATVAAGVHTIVVEYYENTGDAHVELVIDAPSGTEPTPTEEPTATPTEEPTTPVSQDGQYLAEYFANETLSAAPALVRVEDSIQHTWNTSSPDPSIPADHFSARWTMSQEFAAGEYTFTIRADDGKRVYLDDQLIIDGWSQQWLSTLSVNTALSAGRHTLRVEMFEVLGDASAAFSITTVALDDDPVGTPPPPTTDAKIMFGLGAESVDAINKPLVADAPVKMLSSWYNRPSDLGWMDDLDQHVMNTKSQGYAHHLIVFTDDWSVSSNIQTPYGTVSGRSYPFSATFLDDVRTLAQTFGAGGGDKLYVTMFTEFQTYPTASYDENYYKALGDVYLDALQVFHTYAPGSKVSLGWGGWESPTSPLFNVMAPYMNASDFQSVQAMESGISKNLTDMRELLPKLHQYGNGLVMVAHHKTDLQQQAVFDDDIKTIFTDEQMTFLTDHGLFAWSFMDDQLINSTTIYNTVVEKVTTYAAD